MRRPAAPGIYPVEMKGLASVGGDAAPGFGRVNADRLAAILAIDRNFVLLRQGLARAMTRKPGIRGRDHMHASFDKRAPEPHWKGRREVQAGIAGPRQDERLELRAAQVLRQRHGFPPAFHAGGSQQRRVFPIRLFAMGLAATAHHEPPVHDGDFAAQAGQGSHTVGRLRLNR